MSEFKVGDKVWVLATVGNADEDRPGWFNFWFTGSSGLYLPASDCRPVEPAVIKDSLITEPNYSEIPNGSSEPLQVGDAVVVVERSHKWRGVRGRIASVSESNEYPLEFISDCGKRLGYFRLSSLKRINKADPINPSHYKQGGIECIEAIKAALGDGFPDYLRGNVMKYLWRYKEKGGVDDLRKSAWYLDRLFKEVGE